MENLLTFFTKLPPLELPVEYSKLEGVGILLVKEQYIDKQKGLCYYCHGDLKSKPPEDVLEKKITPKLYPHGFFTRPIHLHHNHKTDMTIGVVHAYCNAVLWEHHNE